MLIWLSQMHPCAPANYREQQASTKTRAVDARHKRRKKKAKAPDPAEWTPEDLEHLDAWLLDKPEDDADDPWETCSITGGRIRASEARKLEEKQWGYLRNG